MKDMSDAIQLRPAGQEDYNFLYDLTCSTMRPYIEATWGWDDVWQQRYLQDFQENFKSELNQIIVLDGQDIGLLSVQQDGTEVFIRNIQILPEHQNKGIGSLIISGIIEQAQQQGYPVTLQVLKVNPARRLYEKLGFTIEEETDTHFKMRRA